MQSYHQETPLVSIIVPVYNGESFLRQSLESIISQTYPNLEILVGDDASLDHTAEVVNSFNDARIIYIRNPINLGQFENVNKLVGLVRGKYVAIYHSDDIYESTIVEREVATLQHFPSVGAVFCLDTFVNASGQSYGQLVLPPEVSGGGPLGYPVILNALLTYKNRFLVCPTSMVPAEVYRDVGGYRDAEFRNTSDLEMWLRIARKYPLAIVEEYLHRYRHGHGSSSQRYHRLRTTAENYFRIMDLYLEEGDRALATPEALAAYEAHRAQDNLMISVNHYILSQREEARAALRRVSLNRLMGSAQIQRVRMLFLCLAIRVLVRLPQIHAIADLFYRRWHVKSYGQKSNQPTGHV